MLEENPQWFNALLYFGPIVNTAIVSIVPVTLISWLRSNEYQTTLENNLELLGKYSLLAGATAAEIEARKKKTQSV